MAERFRTQFCLTKDVLLAEFCRIMSLVACSWVLLRTVYFSLISFSKAYSFKSFGQDRSSSEKLDPCEELCDKQGGDEKKKGESLDERADEHNKNDNGGVRDDDFQEDVESFWNAPMESEVIEFSFDDQLEPENDSAPNAQETSFREKLGIEHVFGKSKGKMQSAFTRRFLKARDFGGPMVSLNFIKEGSRDLQTEASSSVGSNCDMFSEGDTSESSFEEDDFLTDNDFVCVEPRPIAHYLSFAVDLCEETKLSDCEDSDEKQFDLSYEFLGEKDEAYERLELICVDALSRPATKKELEEEVDDDDDNEISISRRVSEASDLEGKFILIFNVNQSSHHNLQSYEESDTLEHALGNDPLSSEEESSIHGSHSFNKQTHESQNKNPGSAVEDTHYGTPSYYDSLRYQGAHNQNSPESLKQSPEVLQKDHYRTNSSNAVNHGDDNHLIVWQMKDTQNHAFQNPLKSTFDQNDPTIDNFLKSEDTNHQTPDLPTEPEFDLQNPDSLEEDDDTRLQNSAESISENWEKRQNEEEDDDGMEALWEHQQMVEQLKMEMRRARGRGLPTIFEESEWPKVMDDLNQWKADDSKLLALAKEDPMAEMQRFYRSYTERMRKFDILNHQKTYSIGFLKLTDSIPSPSGRKTAIPALTSVVSQNFRRNGGRKGEMQLSAEFMRQLQVDLETVYVAQVCLSWEYLHWQYIRFRDLSESDPHCCRNLNRVAGEFQTFLILLTRFMEDERFKGPRVDNYVKSRYVQGSLLQVPLVREEKGRKIDGEGEQGTSHENLLEIMEECLRAFSEFVRRDRDEIGTILKGLLGVETELQDPSDAELLADVQAIVQKKDKGLKDLQRSGNCLVKRFQRLHQHHGAWMDESLIFSLVDLKLVSRVLRMSRVRRDQLEWCLSKLLKVTVKGKKLVRDPSFLLFPC